MKFFVAGLGSMGKRRVRCLKALGHEHILGFDLRADRREEAERRYGIKTVCAVEDVDFNEIELIIISTPPDKHNPYIRVAIEKEKPAFVEASVVLQDLEQLNELAKQKNVFIAPSCTMLFHPAIKDINNIIKSGKYGKVTNFSYHSGQYLPDWHPWEDVKDFYVSHKETGAAREIVPFELMWIVDVIGFPKVMRGFLGQTTDVGADIDDTYVVTLDFGEAYGSIIVDVVSRWATRSLILNMEYGQIRWDWDDAVVKLYDARTQRWIHYHCPQGQNATGYNKNIIEDMYLDELRLFINAAKGVGSFPNCLDKDIEVLKLLEKMEKNYEQQQRDLVVSQS